MRTSESNKKKIAIGVGVAGGVVLVAMIALAVLIIVKTRVRIILLMKTNVTDLFRHRQYHLVFVPKSMLIWRLENRYTHILLGTTTEEWS